MAVAKKTYNLSRCLVCVLAAGWITVACSSNETAPPQTSNAWTNGAGSGAAANATVCPSTLTSCASGCVDVFSDRANCGACGKACAAGLACQQGQCTAAVCEPACAAGQLCSAGVCTCPAGQTLCGGACVDLLTTPQNCGACGAMCGAGQLCQAGQCLCAPGQTLCGAACADLQNTVADCGACGVACAPGQACMAGVCSEPLGADGCVGSAHDISLAAVDAYQTIKIPLSKGATPIMTAARNAAVVQGRSTLFRVSVTPATGFVPRQLSARVVVKNGMATDQYFSKMTVSKASTDADSASTFQITVPPEKIQADTSYSVELVECGAAPASGTMLQPRLPAMGDLALDARKTGVLKVTVIPLVANAHTADTTDATLATYRAYMEAMYPIEHLELTVGKPLNITYPVNWNNALDQLRQQRATDKPAADVYYFGMLKPTDTFKDYCRSGCTAGVGYVGAATQSATHVAMGLAFGDETSAAVMAHEVGHNHGRNHAPCAPGNQISGVDPMYPYAGAITNTWGYDARSQKFMAPDKNKDIMGYCDPKWISDYNYIALIDRVATINGSMFTYTPDDVLMNYQVMLIDDDGPRWSQPFTEPEAPFGDAEPADVLDIDGNAIDSVTVYRTATGDDEGTTLLVPPAKQGWNAVRTIDGTLLPFSAPISIPRPQ